MQNGQTTGSILIKRDEKEIEIYEKKIIGSNLDNKFRISNDIEHQEVPENTFFRLHIISCLKYKGNHLAVDDF